MPVSNGTTLDPASYTVGWICALRHELAASRAMLVEEHGRIKEQDPQDHNVYALGTVAGHNVVMACLPAGKYGTESAATVAKDMLRTFSSIKFGLLVGVGGGVPSATNDIRLGDVVVSKPSNQDGGVIQYDTGIVLQGNIFQRRGSLNKPPEVLLNAVSYLSASHEMEDPKLSGYLAEMFTAFPKMRAAYASPGRAQDRLYDGDCEHTENAEACARCTETKEIPRPERLNAESAPDDSPAIHYGLIASGKKVIASSIERDHLRRDADILCFEMEAAGLMDSFPCLVVRGISDYADSHKNDQWQRYAAATAAAYAKELLGVITPRQVASTPKAATVICEY